MAKRLAGRFGYPKDDPFRVTFHRNKLKDPLTWHKSYRIFVCSMGDLFHEEVKEEWINNVFYVMKNCPQHIFTILTKRPENIELMLYDSNILGGGDYLSNVHLGVSVENQKKANERIPILLHIPAAKRFVSIEPMLGQIRLDDWIFSEHNGPDPFETQDEFYQRCNERLAWVILGGESGPGARPMHPKWVRSVRDQCVKAGVPFFIKQIHINGKILKNPVHWPKDLRIRELLK
jgi:protein gp37